MYSHRFQRLVVGVESSPRRMLSRCQARHSCRCRRGRDRITAASMVSTRDPHERLCTAHTRDHAQCSCDPALRLHLDRVSAWLRPRGQPLQPPAVLRLPQNAGLVAEGWSRVLGSAEGGGTARLDRAAGQAHGGEARTPGTGGRGAAGLWPDRGQALLLTVRGAQCLWRSARAAPAVAAIAVRCASCCCGCDARVGSDCGTSP